VPGNFSLEGAVEAAAAAGEQAATAMAVRHGAETAILAVSRPCAY
jgi:hypothetical protein